MKNKNKNTQRQKNRHWRRNQTKSKKEKIVKKNFKNPENSFALFFFISSFVKIPIFLYPKTVCCIPKTMFCIPKQFLYPKQFFVSTTKFFVSRRKPLYPLKSFLYPKKSFRIPSQKFFLYPKTSTTFTERCVLKKKKLFLYSQKSGTRIVDMETNGWKLFHLRRMML